MSSVLEAVRSQNSAAPIEAINSVDALHELVEELQRVTDHAGRLEDVPAIFRNADTLRAIDGRITALRGRVGDREVARMTSIEQRFKLLREILDGRKQFQPKNTIDRGLDRVLPETMSRDEKRIVGAGAAAGTVAVGGLLWLQLSGAGRRLRERAGSALRVVQIAAVAGLIAVAGLLGIKAYGELKKYKDQLEAAQRAVQDARDAARREIGEVRDAAGDAAVERAKGRWTDICTQLRTDRTASAEGARRRLSLEVAPLLLTPALKERFRTETGLQAGAKLTVDSEHRVHRFVLGHTDADGFSVEQQYLPEYLANGVSQSAVGLAALSGDVMSSLREEQRRLLVDLFQEPRYAAVKRMTVGQVLAITDAASAPAPLNADEPALQVVRLLARACDARKALVEPGLPAGKAVADMQLEEFLVASAPVTKVAARLDEGLRAPRAGRNGNEQLRDALGRAFDPSAFETDLSAATADGSLTALSVPAGREAAFLAWCRQNDGPLSAANAPAEFQPAVVALRAAMTAAKPQLAGYLHHHQAPKPVLDRAVDAIGVTDAVRLFVSCRLAAKVAPGAETNPGAPTAGGALLLQLQVLKLVATADVGQMRELQYLLRDHRRQDHDGGKLVDPRQDGAANPITLPPATQRMLLNLVKGTASVSDRARGAGERLERELGHAIFRRAIDFQYDTFDYADRPKNYGPQVEAILRADQLKIFQHPAWAATDDAQLGKLITDAGYPALAADPGYVAGAKLVVAFLRKSRPMLEAMCRADERRLEDVTLGEAVDLLANAGKAGTGLSGEIADSVKDDIVPSIGLDLLRVGFDNAKHGAAAGGKVRDVFERKKDAFKSKMAEVIMRDLLPAAELQAMDLRMEWQDDRAEVEQACSEFVAHMSGDGAELRAVALFTPDTRVNKIKNKLRENFVAKIKEPAFAEQVTQCLAYAVGQDQERREKVAAIIGDACRDGTFTATDAFQLYYLIETGRISQDGGRFTAMLKAIDIIQKKDADLGTKLFANVFGKLTAAGMKAAGRSITNVLFSGDPLADVPEPLRREFRNVVSYYGDELKDKCAAIKAVVEDYVVPVAGVGTGILAYKVVGWNMNRSIRIATAAQHYGVTGDAMRRFLGQGGFWNRALTMNKMYQYNLSLEIRRQGAMVALHAQKNPTMLRDCVKFIAEMEDAKDLAKVSKYFKDAGWTADKLGDLVQVFRAEGWGTYDDIARCLRTGGFDNVDDIAKALKLGGCTSADDVAKALKAANWGADDIVKGLRTAGWTHLDDLAKALKAAELPVDDVFRVLSAGAGAGDDVARTMRAAGFLDADVARLAAGRPAVPVTPPGPAGGPPSPAPRPAPGVLPPEVTAKVPVNLIDDIKLAIPDEVAHVAFLRRLAGSDEMVNALQTIWRMAELRGEVFPNLIKALNESDDLFRVANGLRGNNLVMALEWVGKADGATRAKVIADILKADAGVQPSLLRAVSTMDPQSVRVFLALDDTFRPGFLADLAKLDDGARAGVCRAMNSMTDFSDIVKGLAPEARVGALRALGQCDALPRNLGRLRDIPTRIRVVQLLGQSEHGVAAAARLETQQLGRLCNALADSESLCSAVLRVHPEAMGRPMQLLGHSDDMVRMITGVGDIGSQCRVINAISHSDEVVRLVKALDPGAVQNFLRALSESDDVARALAVLPREAVTDLAKAFGYADDVARALATQDEATRLLTLTSHGVPHVPGAGAARPATGAGVNAAARGELAALKSKPGMSKWMRGLAAADVAFSAVSLGISIHEYNTAIEFERNLKDNIGRMLYARGFREESPGSGVWKKGAATFTFKSLDWTNRDVVRSRIKIGTDVLATAGGVAALTGAISVTGPLAIGIALGALTVHIACDVDKFDDKIKAINDAEPWMLAYNGASNIIGDKAFTMLDLSYKAAFARERTPEMRTKVIWGMFWEELQKNETLAGMVSHMVPNMEPDTLNDFYENEFKTFVLPAFYGFHANFSPKYNNASMEDVWNMRFVKDYDITADNAHYDEAIRTSLRSAARLTVFHMREKRYMAAWDTMDESFDPSNQGKMALAWGADAAMQTLGAQKVFGATLHSVRDELRANREIFKRNGFDRVMPHGIQAPDTPPTRAELVLHTWLKRHTGDPAVFRKPLNEGGWPDNMHIVHHERPNGFSPACIPWEGDWAMPKSVYMNAFQDPYQDKGFVDMDNAMNNSSSFLVKKYETYRYERRQMPTSLLTVRVREHNNTQYRQAVEALRQRAIVDMRAGPEWQLKPVLAGMRMIRIQGEVYQFGDLADAGFTQIAPNGVQTVWRFEHTREHGWRVRSAANNAAPAPSHEALMLRLLTVIPQEEVASASPSKSLLWRIVGPVTRDRDAVKLVDDLYVHFCAAKDKAKFLRVLQEKLTRRSRLTDLAPAEIPEWFREHRHLFAFSPTRDPAADPAFSETLSSVRVRNLDGREHLHVRLSLPDTYIRHANPAAQRLLQESVRAKATELGMPVLACTLRCEGDTDLGRERAFLELPLGLVYDPADAAALPALEAKLARLQEHVAVRETTEPRPSPDVATSLYATASFDVRLSPSIDPRKAADSEALTALKACPSQPWGRVVGVTFDKLAIAGGSEAWHATFLIMSQDGTRCVAMTRTAVRPAGQPLQVDAALTQETDQALAARVELKPMLAELRIAMTLTSELRKTVTATPSFQLRPDLTTQMRPRYGDVAFRVSGLRDGNAADAECLRQLVSWPVLHSPADPTKTYTAPGRSLRGISICKQVIGADDCYLVTYSYDGGHCLEMAALRRAETGVLELGAFHLVQTVEPWPPREPADINMASPPAELAWPAFGGLTLSLPTGTRVVAIGALDDGKTRAMREISSNAPYNCPNGTTSLQIWNPGVSMDQPASATIAVRNAPPADSRANVLRANAVAEFAPRAEAYGKMPAAVAALASYDDLSHGTTRELAAQHWKDTVSSSLVGSNRFTREDDGKLTWRTEGGSSAVVVMEDVPATERENAVAALDATRSLVVPQPGGMPGARLLRVKFDVLDLKTPADRAAFLAACPPWMIPWLRTSVLAVPASGATVLDDDIDWDAVAISSTLKDALRTRKEAQDTLNDPDDVETAILFSRYIECIGRGDPSLRAELFGSSLSPQELMEGAYSNTLVSAWKLQIKTRLAGRKAADLGAPALATVLDAAAVDAAVLALPSIRERRYLFLMQQIQKETDPAKRAFQLKLADVLGTHLTHHVVDGKSIFKRMRDYQHRYGSSDHRTAFSSSARALDARREGLSPEEIRAFRVASDPLGFAERMRTGRDAAAGKPVLQSFMTEAASLLTAVEDLRDCRMAYVDPPELPAMDGILDPTLKAEHVALEQEAGVLKEDMWGKRYAVYSALVDDTLQPEILRIAALLPDVAAGSTGVTVAESDAWKALNEAAQGEQVMAAARLGQSAKTALTTYSALDPAHEERMLAFRRREQALRTAIVDRRGSFYTDLRVHAEVPSFVPAAALGPQLFAGRRVNVVLSPSVHPVTDLPRLRQIAGVVDTHLKDIAGASLLGLSVEKAARPDGKQSYLAVFRWAEGDNVRCAQFILTEGEGGVTTASRVMGGYAEGGRGATAGPDPLPENASLLQTAERVPFPSENLVANDPAKVLLGNPGWACRFSPSLDATADKDALSGLSVWPIPHDYNERNMYRPAGYALEAVTMPDGARYYRATYVFMGVGRENRPLTRATTLRPDVFTVTRFGRMKDGKFEAAPMADRMETVPMSQGVRSLAESATSGVYLTERAILSMDSTKPMNQSEALAPVLFPAAPGAHQVVALRDANVDETADLPALRTLAGWPAQNNPGAPGTLRGYTDFTLAAVLFRKRVVAGEPRYVASYFYRNWGNAWQVREVGMENGVMGHPSVSAIENYPSDYRNTVLNWVEARSPRIPALRPGYRIEAPLPLEQYRSGEPVHLYEHDNTFFRIGVGASAVVNQTGETLTADANGVIRCTYPGAYILTVTKPGSPEPVLVPVHRYGIYSAGGIQHRVNP